MKAWLGGFIVSTLAAAVAACGAPGEQSTSTTNADTATPAFDPDYEAFTTRADAEAYIQKHLDDIFGDAPLPATDPRTVRAQAALDKHWPAIVAKYNPSYPEPIVFVVDDDATINAMAMFDPSTDKAFNIIYVYSGIMKFSDADLETTLLHESGHLTAKNGISRYAQALTKYYQAGRTEGVGIATPNDPNVEASVTPYLDNVFTVGHADVPEMDGVPFGDQAGMAFFFARYQSAHASASNPDCATLTAQLDSAQKLIKAGTTPFDGSIVLTSDQSTALTQTASAIESTAISCLRPPADVDLGAELTEAFGFPVGAFAQARPDEVPTWTGKDAISGLFAMTRDLYAKERSFEGAPGYKQLRVYTGEEQADDFAVTILAFEGIDSAQMATMFLDYTADETSRAECAVMLANGVVPPYNFIEPHHGNCYRAYHVGQLAQ